MTDREKAIVMAYTGIAMLVGEKINEYYKYLAELYGRPVYTHEIVTLDIAEKAKPDFIRLCEETHGDVISRQAAIDAIRHIEEIYVNNLPTMIDKASAQTELMLLPSAEPNVIHCKDCKYYLEGSDGLKYCFNHDDDILWFDDDFCSKAKRRNDE